MRAKAAVETMLTESRSIKETLLRSSAPAALREQALSIEKELLALQQELSGNERRALYNSGGPVSISGRLEAVVIGTFRSTYGPTPNLEQNVDIAEQSLDGVSAEIDRINDEALPELRSQLDAENVPWTPGRGISADD